MFFRYHQDPPATPSLLKFLPQKQQDESSPQSSFPLISPTLFDPQSPSLFAKTVERTSSNSSDSLSARKLSHDFVSGEDEVEFVATTPPTLCPKKEPLVLTNFGREFYSSVKRKIERSLQPLKNSEVSQNLFSLSQSGRLTEGSLLLHSQNASLVLVQPEQSQNIFLSKEQEKENIFSLNEQQQSKFSGERLVSERIGLGRKKSDSNLIIDSSEGEELPLNKHRISVGATEFDSSLSVERVCNSYEAYQPLEHNDSLECGVFLNSPEYLGKVQRSFESEKTIKKSEELAASSDVIAHSGEGSIAPTHNSSNPNCLSHCTNVSSHQVEKSISFVWAKRKLNEYCIAQLMDYSEQTELFTVKFTGSDKESKVRKKDLILCRHSVGDLVICSQGFFSMIVEVCSNSKYFELVRLDRKYDRAILFDMESTVCNEESTSESCSRVHLNTLLFRQRHGEYIFSNWSFIITTAAEAAMEKRIYEKCIKENGGSVISAKENLTSLVDFIESCPKGQTILLANEPKRTIKYIYAISQDIPRVNVSWLEKCIKVGEFLPFTFQKNFLLPNAKDKKKSTALSPPPPLNKQLLPSHTFYIKGSTSFSRIWSTIIASLGGHLSDSPQDHCLIVDEKGDKRENSTLNLLVNSIIDQSDCLV